MKPHKISVANAVRLSHTLPISTEGETPMPYPDNFSAAAYDAGPGGSYRPEPPLIVADHADLEALAKYRAALHRAHETLRDNPWTFDSTEIPPHAWLLADSAAFLRQMDLAIKQAVQSRECVA